MANAIKSSSKAVMSAPKAPKYSPTRSPPKKMVLESEEVKLDIDSDPDFNETVFTKQEPQGDDKKGTKKKATNAPKKRSTTDGAAIPRPPSRPGRRPAGVKTEPDSSDDDSPSSTRSIATKRGAAKPPRTSVFSDSDADELADRKPANDWDKKGRAKAKKVHRREAKAKGVNPLRVLAGASESSDSGASSDDSARSDCAKVRVEQVIPIEVKAEVVSGSETEDEEPAVDPAEESDEDLADPDAWRKKAVPPRAPTKASSGPSSASGGHSQSSQGSARSQSRAAPPVDPASMDKRRQDQAQPAVTVIDYRPVEFSPYTPEQLAMGPLPLTGDANGPSVPQPLNRLLREYQRDGVRFLYDKWAAGQGAVLGDDMGLGKTIQVISFLSAIMRKTGLRSADDQRRHKWVRQNKRDGKMKPGIVATNAAPGSVWPTALIIAPSSVCYNWERELSTWGYFSVGVYMGTDRQRVLQEYKKGWYDVVIVGFETASKDILEFYDLDWGCIIADEVHRLKNPRSNQTINLNKFHCRRRFGLTGTAVQNKLTEFWCILDWARPGELGTMKQFRAFISDPIAASQSHEADAETLVIGRMRAIQWTRRILPHFFLRRTKAIIAHQMPKKKDLIVSCLLSEKQIECFHRLRESEDVQLMITKDDPCDCDRFDENGNRTRRIECCYKTNSQGMSMRDLLFKYVSIFRRCANHLALLLPSEDDSEAQREANRSLIPLVLPDLPAGAVRYHEQSIDRSLCGKWAACKSLLDHWRPNNEPNDNKVLIFSMSVKLLKILEFFVNLAGYSYEFMHGGVPSDRRMEMVDRFQTKPEVYIFLISTLTGGVGLNLTAANKVIIFDPSWNPANDMQAMDRAFRIGQKSDVEVYRLVAAGSIEEIIYTRQIYKRQSSNIAYEATKEKRNFNGIMDDRNHQGELFGVKNLFSLREDGRGIMETAQRIEEIETDVTGVEIELEVARVDATFKFDEDAGNSLKFSQGDDLEAVPESILNLIDGKEATDEKPDDDDVVTRLLQASGATFAHQDDLFLGDNKVEHHVLKAARKTYKERPLDAGLIDAYQNASTFKYAEAEVKKRKKRVSSGPSPAKKKVAKMQEEEKNTFLPTPRLSKIAQAANEEMDQD